jgi:citrate synthase
MPEASSGNGKVALRFGDGGELDLPVKAATEGSAGIEVTKLLSTTAMVTLDPGFVNTAACSSEITYIDGDAGILRYRGYPIEQLAEKSSFLEVSYLLFYGALPTSGQLADFTEKVTHHTLLDEDFKTFFSAFPRTAHPMAVLSSAVSALSSFYPGHLDPHNEADVDLSMIRLLAKLPTLGAYFYKRSIGQPYLYPDNSLSLVENFLRMTFGLPAEEYKVDPEVAKALDMLFVLHAEHEQNCSTSTVRVVGSSEANVFASISAGVHALSGPLHGGANAAVLDMLEDIRDQGGDDRLIAKLAPDDHLLDLAMQLEEVALKDDYFISRKLYPNVDFYTGLIYRAMGFPTEMFTVLFAIGRLPGWLAHYKEMLHDPATKIARPRQVYTGPTERDFLEIEKR